MKYRVRVRAKGEGAGGRVGSGVITTVGRAWDEGGRGVGWPPQRGRKPPSSDSQHYTPIKSRTGMEEEEELEMGICVFLERSLHSRRQTVGSWGLRGQFPVHLSPFERLDLDSPNSQRQSSDEIHFLLKHSQHQHSLLTYREKGVHNYILFY